MAPTIIVDDRDGLVKAFVAELERASSEAIRARRRFTLAVTGGRDALVLLPPLADAAIDWTRSEVFWGDERAVPFSDPDSNYGQIKRAWLDHAAVPSGHVHPMPVDGTDLDQAAGKYATLLEATLGPSLSLDACVLGMGPDGHVCSIFPGHRLMAERDRLVALVEDAPKPPARRLTLTLPMLTRAKLVVVMALSADKRRVLDDVLAGRAPDLPVARVLREAARAVVLAGEVLRS
jgi:6-phosphogluconolactonase